MKILRADAPVHIQPPETCPHDRAYTWFARLIANDSESPRLLCMGCCDCGTGWTRLAKGQKVEPEYADALREAIG